MKIFEYIETQAKDCKHDIMKEVFISLDRRFNQKIENKTNVNVSDIIKKLQEKINNDDNLYHRKVRVQTSKNTFSLGLIDNDGYDIHLSSGITMEYLMYCDDVSYYATDDNFFYKEEDSRIVKLIDETNYKKHKSNIYFMRDYIERNLDNLVLEKMNEWGKNKSNRVL